MSRDIILYNGTEKTTPGMKRLQEFIFTDWKPMESNMSGK
jgi:hypothetical protein